MNISLIRLKKENQERKHYSRAITNTRKVGRKGRHKSRRERIEKNAIIRGRTVREAVGKEREHEMHMQGMMLSFMQQIMSTITGRGYGLPTTHPMPSHLPHALYSST